MAPQVVVVGGGGAGIATAWHLVRLGAQVTLVEAEERLGGNCARVMVPDDRDREWPLDMGVSDFNSSTFHEFGAFLEDMGLSSRPINEDATALYRDGSVAWSQCGGRFHMAGTTGGDGCIQTEIRRFVLQAPGVLDAPPQTLGEYLDRNGHSDLFARLHALPRASACIVMPDGDPRDFDMAALVRFWLQHGLVGTVPRRRRHLPGGMWTYCDRFHDWFRARGGEVLCGTRVHRIQRGSASVSLGLYGAGGCRELSADHVVLAVDASHVARLLPDVEAEERCALSSLGWASADVVVHRDRRLLAIDPRFWAAYNFYASRPGETMAGPRITFYPHRLAAARAPGVLVSVNPPVEPRASLIIDQRRMVHPVAAHRRRFDALQGRRRTWFAGSYLIPPHLHEQAFESGHRVAEELMASIRWRTKEVIPGTHHAVARVSSRTVSPCPA
ncbi:MAG TPA: FAD-dependent oxidoreductase [Xanthomonadaceae bacterium]|nr:FAD-dependent oxidoreductase [Xanthomonadaceae bacterium]